MDELVSLDLLGIADSHTERNDGTPSRPPQVVRPCQNALHQVGYWDGPCCRVPPRTLPGFFDESLLIQFWGLNEIVTDEVRMQEVLVGEQVIWEFRGDLSQLFENLRRCVNGFQVGYPKTEAADLVCLRRIKLSHTSSPHRGFRGPGS